MSNLDYKKDQGAWHKYGVSKAGNILHAKEFARRYKDQGVISIVGSPYAMAITADKSGP